MKGQAVSSGKIQLILLVLLVLFSPLAIDIYLPALSLISETFHVEQRKSHVKATGQSEFCSLNINRETFRVERVSVHQYVADYGSTGWCRRT